MACYKASRVDPLFHKKLVVILVLSQRGKLEVLR
jgi:hypothetical protein